VPDRPAAIVPVTLDAEALKPLVRAVVEETLAAVRSAEAAVPTDRLCYSEPEAARLLGLEAHQLRDERLRGRIVASKVVGSRIRYQRSDLLDYLAERRVEA
jgi:hypothetical protein